MDDRYATDAAYYDVWNTREDDIAAWCDLAEASGGPVLEVGSGTGRIALALEERVSAITGLERSRAMLALARERAERQGSQVTFVEGDATEAPRVPGGPFMLVLAVSDLLLHCRDGEEQHAWLTAFREALRPNGLLVVDLPGPAAWLDPESAGQPLHVWGGPLSGDERLDVWQIRRDDLARQRRHLTVVYERTAGDGRLARSYSEHELRYIYRYEAELLLEAAGLRKAGVYGDYEFGALHDESERMIFFARPASG